MKHPVCPLLVHGCGWREAVRLVQAAAGPGEPVHIRVARLTVDFFTLARANHPNSPMFYDFVDVATALASWRITYARSLEMPLPDIAWVWRPTDNIALVPIYDRAIHV